MKILLLNPPSAPGTTTDRRQRCTVKSPKNWVHPPIALAYLATCLNKWNKAEVKLVDAVVDNMSLKDTIKVAENFSADLIISPIGSYSFPWDFRVLSEIKKITFAKMACFGELPTALADKFLSNYPELDYCIKGEPEYSSSKLVSYLSGQLPIDQVNNLVYRAGQEIIHNHYAIIEDLDAITYPDRSLLKNEKYHCIPFFSGLFTDLTTSKGCPFNCKFCTTNEFWGRKYRFRSVVNILGEIDQCINIFGIDKFFIPDETFTVNKKWLNELMVGLKERKVKWALQTRVDLVDKEILKDMSEAGCVYIHFGAESGSQEILDYYRKDITVQQVKNAFKWSREVGIETSATFVLGSPAETKETAQKTIDLAKEIKADYYHFSPLIPHPLSEFFRQFKKEGKLKHFRFEEYVKPNIIFISDNMTDKQINYYINKAYKETVMNLQYAVRRFLKVIKKGDWTAFVVLMSGAWWTIKTFMRKND